MDKQELLKVVMENIWIAKNGRENKIQVNQAHYIVNDILAGNATIENKEGKLFIIGPFFTLLQK